MNEDNETRLIKIAVSMARKDGFISPFEEDNPKSTPKKILRQAEDQHDILNNWSYELRNIADSLK